MLAATCRTAGVVEVQPSANLTEERGERVRGVGIVAEVGGRYEVRMSLVAAPVPLHELAERVREEIRRAARGARLEDRIGRIVIAIVDLESPAEMAA